MRDLAQGHFGRELVTHMADLLRYAMLLTRHRGDAEDLVQETLRKALDLQAHYTPGTNMRAWLFAIQTNAHRDERKRRAKLAVRETSDDDALARYPQPASQLDRVFFAEAEDSIELLPPDQKRALYLVVFDGLSYSEAAERLACSEGTVKSRVSRARAALAEMLRQPEPSQEPRFRPF
jgi:RNA polymerase sigma-70 factor (ECF subfamily)